MDGLALVAVVETNLTSESLNALGRRGWAGAILMETCHAMHDRSSRNRGRDGQKLFAEGR